MFALFSSLASNLLLWIWIAGFIAFWFLAAKTRRTRAWTFILFAGFWAISSRPFADAVLKPLENIYPVPEVSALREEGVREVVVLSGGGYPIRGEILSSALPHASIYRFVGGLEICRLLGPGSRLIFSGSAGRGRDLPTASTMKDLANRICPELEVVAEVRSDSTWEHPANIKPLLRGNSFILVTSAAHMARSVRTFARVGLNPVPYPVDHLSRVGYGWIDLLPSIESLWVTGVALREYEALLFYKIRGI